MQGSTFARRARRALKAAVLAGVLVLTSFGMVGPSTAQDRDLGVDEISHSANIKPLANVPRQGPLANATHSDLAFYGNYAIQGTYAGFTIYNIQNPTKPETISQMACNGGQGDPTVSEDGKLLFVSVDTPQSDPSCASTNSNAANPNAWEGIRIFDISDKQNPKYVKSVRTDCGSHTHTYVPTDGGDTAYLYISSYGPSPAFPHCQPPHDKISIVKVPLDDPDSASVVATPVLFPDGGAGATAGCHDITVFPEKDLAAGACMGEGALIDISDPTKPYVITSATDANFAFWHSATFTNDGNRVVFTDELGGGGAPTCNEQIGPNRGADAIFDIKGEGDNRELVFRSYFKIPRMQQQTENCVAHNGSLIPAKHRDMMVQAWYQGGVSVIDFTDPDHPKEIGYFERGPLSKETLQTGGSWSAYWYNGRIYSSDITKGLDVLQLTGAPASANRVRLDFMNPQTQYSYKP
ncbi:LVIVD repeat-containing protein [Streptomyces sp. NPDC001698]|uniref:LVIVD repeat-containing protein n=1 Tax=unclassified Streptomyces TaxID=2593676 RepID=UPI0036C43841